MALVYVNIGSNLGNRKQLIETAVEIIADKFGICCLSNFIESEPWGFESVNRFLNLGVSFHSDMHPENLLAELQKIEKKISKVGHRDCSGQFKDREIDIDIMAIGESQYTSETLTVPHIHLLEREFFMRPLLELSPLWKHPGGMAMERMKKQTSDK